MRFCLSLLLLATLHASAQPVADTFTVKNATNFIHPYEKKYIQYAETAEGLIIFNSILTRKAQKTTFNGKNVWLFTQNYQTAKAINKDSSYCDEQTLLPVAYCSGIASENTHERVLFMQQEVLNRVTQKDSTQEFTHINHHRYNGVMANDLVTTLPLQANRTFVFKTLNPGLRYWEYLTIITVEGKEDLEVSGIGKIPCWKIHVSEGGGRTSTEWYSINGLHQVKMIYPLKNGNYFVRMMLVG